MQKSPSQGSTSYLFESIGLEKQNKPCIFKEVMIHRAIFNSKIGRRSDFRCQTLIKHNCQTIVFFFFFYFNDTALTARSHSVSLLCPLFVSFQCCQWGERGAGGPAPGFGALPIKTHRAYMPAALYNTHILSHKALSRLHSHAIGQKVFVCAGLFPKKRAASFPF